MACPMHPAFAAMMREAGAVVEEAPTLLQNEVESSIGDYEILIVTTKTKVGRRLIDKGRRLEVIGRAGSGMDTIDVAYAKAKGIVCINSPEGNRNAVAEHAMAMVLGLQNHLLRADREVRQGIWQREENRGTEMSQQTVGIIGFGHTGRSFAAKWLGFGNRVIAYDKYYTHWDQPHVEEVSFEQLIAESDVISFHVPLTSETRAWVNESFIQQLPRPVILVNTSRGPIFDLAAVAEGLESGKLKGVCLDVLPEEPLTQKVLANDNALKKLVQREDVVFSPHIAGWSVQSHKSLSVILAEKVLQFYRV